MLEKNCTIILTNTCFVLYFQKAYKRFYQKNTNRDLGTLYSLKCLLKRTEVNGNVKSRFEVHQDLFLTVGECYLVEMALEYLGMADAESQPTSVLVPENISKVSRIRRQALADDILGGILDHYGFARFCLEHLDHQQINPPEPTHKEYHFMGRLPGGQLLLKEVEVVNQRDHIMAYGIQFCHWALHLMHLNDMAHEGDFDRTVAAVKLNIPYFFSHSKLSHYFKEAIDFILKTTLVSSPKMRFHLLEGSFVNIKGRKGGCVETDLVMEHSVRNKKDLIRSLGAKKTKTAIERVSDASDTVAELHKNFMEVIGVKRLFGHHSRPISDVDMNKAKNRLRNIRPFSYKGGRSYEQMKKLHDSPFGSIDKEQMKEFLRRNIIRLCRGQVDPLDDIQSDDEGDDEDFDEEVELPPLP